MDEKIYSITLSDGTRLENLRLNGNNFISDEEITEDMFEDNLYTVIFSDGNTEETYKDLELIQISEQDGEYWFVLAEISESKKVLDKISSMVYYIAMMSDIEL